MLGSITPLGERSRGRRWGVTVTALVLGSAAGGMLIGGALGWLGQAVAGDLSPATRVQILAGAIALALIVDSGVLGSVPSYRRQVNEDWIPRYRGWVTGVGFGFQLGLAVATVVTTAAVYATLVATFLAGSLEAGAIIGAAFGLVRGLTVVSVARVRRPEQVVAVDATLGRLERPARIAALGLGACLLVTAIAAT